MKNVMMRMITYRRALSLVLLVLAAFSVPDIAMAASQQKAWTNVGSGGVVDDTDLGRVKLAGPNPFAYLASGVGSGTIRYNVTATEGLFIGPNKTLSVRFYKPDNFSVVTARLWAVDVTTGAVSSLIAFDSTPYPASGSLQTQSVTANLPQDFDFNAKAYFVEVTLFRQTNASGTLVGDPRLVLLKILSQ